MQIRQTLATAATALVLALPGPGRAEDSGWQFTATGYAWLPASRATVDTPRGSVSGELGVSDALDALDLAAMGSLEARRGKLGLVADLLYFNLTQTVDTPFGALFQQGRVETRMAAVTALAMWRVQETDTFSLDLGGGLRASESEVTVTLSGGLLPTETVRREGDGVDPVLALRMRMDFDEKWFGTLYLDGGGSGDEQTRQAGLGLGYRIDDRWSVLGGWRYLEFERETGGQKLDFDMSGVILGASYRF